MSQIARKFRTRLGESLATVEKHSTPLLEATTPSFEALKVYTTDCDMAPIARILPWNTLSQLEAAPRF